MNIIPLVVSTIGHAAWDNVLHWMIVNDPDASVLHMHWLRTCIIWVFLFISNRHKEPVTKPIMWWMWFSLTGWTIPTLAYTTCVMLTGYRISISFQPFIPLFVALNIGAPLKGRRLAALNFALLGTLCVWIWAPWYHKNDIELWKIWISVVCAFLHIASLSIWFVMLNSVDKNHLATITRGVGISILTLFFGMVVWTPQHLFSTFMIRWDMWLIIICLAAAAAAAKQWVIAYCSTIMSADAVAIFECLHPIATLCCDVIMREDVFEYEDILTISFFAIGWILYPKTNI